MGGAVKRGEQEEQHEDVGAAVSIQEGEGTRVRAATAIQSLVRGIRARNEAALRKKQPRPSSAELLLQRLRAGKLSGAQVARAYSRRPAAVVQRLRQERQDLRQEPQERLPSQSRSLSDAKPK